MPVPEGRCPAWADFEFFVGNTLPVCHSVITGLQPCLHRRGRHDRAGGRDCHSAIAGRASGTAWARWWGSIDNVKERNRRDYNPAPPGGGQVEPCRDVGRALPAAGIAYTNGTRTGFAGPCPGQSAHSTAQRGTGTSGTCPASMTGECGRRTPGTASTKSPETLSAPLFSTRSDYSPSVPSPAASSDTAAPSGSACNPIQTSIPRAAAIPVEKQPCSR